jgi:shikimate 5-dehydrogenase
LVFNSNGLLHQYFAASQPTDPTTSPLARRLFVVMGAGGAAKAVAYGAKEKGARVVIANRTFGILTSMELFFSKKFRFTC